MGISSEESDLCQAPPARAEREAGPGADDAAGQARTTATLGSLFRRYRGRLLLTYGLFSAENLLRLAQPLILGLAINDLLRGSTVGLALFIAQHLGHLVLSTLRRLYDTRAFTSIYTDLATQLVVEQRRRDVAVSCVAARSALSRAFVDFFEADVPVVLHALYSLGGALVMLSVYDGRLVLLCLGLVLPAVLLNRLYSRLTLRLSGGLHDEFEREVSVIEDGQPAVVRAHYQHLARWRVRLSDWEALNFGVMELFVLGLMAAALLLVCTTPAATPGDIVAVFRYVLLFLTGLDSVPQLVQQVSRLRDIGRRIGAHSRYEP